MFFNRVWLGVMVLLLLVAGLVRQPVLALVAMLVLLTGWGSRLWSRHALRGTALHRRLRPSRVFQGETVTLEYELINWKVLPLAWIRVEDELPDQLKPIDRRAKARGSTAALAHLTSLGPYESVAWGATVRCPERGAFAIGPTTLATGDPFGFFRRLGSVARQDVVIVYPPLVPLPQLGIPPRQVFGEARAPRALVVDPLRPIGVRDYHPEDSLRHVHWKATARAQELQVRVFEPSTVTQVVVCLNCDAVGSSWYRSEPQAFELAITAAASLAAHAIDRRYAVGVLSNRLVGGTARPLRVPAGRGAEQLGRMLEGLARLTVAASGDFPSHLLAEAGRLPRGSTVVIVSAAMSPALAVALETLRALGYRLVLVAVAPMAPPPVRGVIVHQIADALRAVRGDGGRGADAPRGRT